MSRFFFLFLYEFIAMKKLLFIIPILILLASCAAQKQIIEVPVETIRTEYIYNTTIDSVVVRDSVDRWRDGDTVFIYKEHTKYKYLNKIDTLIRVDTISKVIRVESVKEVEVNHIRWYQKILMWVGGIMSLILTGYIIYKMKLK